MIDCKTDIKTDRTVPVSVVIPCYNCATTVGRAVESVFSQSSRPAEVLLVDDASSDETSTVLDALAAQYGKWVTLACLSVNSGPATARNTGWERASQPYIAFLDADDSWHPFKIELQYNWMAAHPDIWLTAHGYRVHGDTSDKHPISGNELQAIPVSFQRLLLSNLFSTPTVMLRRDVAYRFLAGKRYAEDYLLWLSIASNHECYFFSQKLTDLHKPVYGTSGLSADMWAMEKGELDTFTRIYRQGDISFVLLIPLYLLSILKFSIRLLCTSMKATP